MQNQISWNSSKLLAAQQQQRGVGIVALHKNPSLIFFSFLFFSLSPHLLLSEQHFNETFHGGNVLSCRLFPDPRRKDYLQIKALTVSFVIAKQIMSRTWKALVSPGLEFQPLSEHQTTMPALFSWYQVTKFHSRFSSVLVLLMTMWMRLTV